jgi:hypothetical protein
MALDELHAIDTPEGIRLRVDIEKEDFVDGYQILDFSAVITVPPGFTVDYVGKAKHKGPEVKVAVRSHYAT